MAERDPWEQDRTSWVFLRGCSVEERLRRGAVKFKKSKLDYAPAYMAWDSCADYRAWCEANVPSYFGYGNNLKKGRQ